MNTPSIAYHRGRLAAFAIHILLSSALVAGAAGNASSKFAGRWSGTVAIPNLETPMVLDLAPNEKGQWTGSITLVRLDVKGNSLGSLVLQDSQIAFQLPGTLTRPEFPMTSARGGLAEQDELRGEIEHGGNRAPFVLHRVGGAEVELPLVSTKVSDALAGRWAGTYERDGYPRHVTLQLRNEGDHAVAELIVVGKQTTKLPIQLVRQHQYKLALTAAEPGIGYEGALDPPSGDLRGIFSLGPSEIPLVFRKEEAKP